MLADRRRDNYKARLSYELEVGSSLDPDIDDIDALERETVQPVVLPRSSPPPYDENDMEEVEQGLDEGDVDAAALYEAYAKELEEDDEEEFAGDFGDFDVSALEF